MKYLKLEVTKRYYVDVRNIKHFLNSRKDLIWGTSCSWRFRSSIR